MSLRTHFPWGYLDRCVRSPSDVTVTLRLILGAPNPKINAQNDLLSFSYQSCLHFRTTLKQYPTEPKLKNYLKLAQIDLKMSPRERACKVTYVHQFLSKSDNISIFATRGRSERVEMGANGSDCAKQSDNHATGPLRRSVWKIQPILGFGSSYPRTQKPPKSRKQSN